MIDYDWLWLTTIDYDWFQLIIWGHNAQYAKGGFSTCEYAPQILKWEYPQLKALKFLQWVLNNVEMLNEFLFKLFRLLIPMYC